MKKVFPVLVAVSMVFLIQNPASGIGLADIQDLLVVTPQDLANELVGAANVVAGSAVFTGDSIAAGIFQNGLVDGLGINSGVILSNGDVQNAVGPNVDGGLGIDLLLFGDPDLDALVAPFSVTLDANVLEFDFVPPPGANVVTFNFVFASDEYNEGVGTRFEDVFGLFVNGVNAALNPISGGPVTINTINGTATPSLFNDNAPPLIPVFGTQFDGFSTVLSGVAGVIPGVVNHVKLAIADGVPLATDIADIDSAVFVAPAFFETVSFSDVLPNAFAFNQIEAIAAAGITGGCAASLFCPNEPITRGQMAVFIETSLGRPPVACLGDFLDVSPANPFCGFIEALAVDGITGGCAPGLFCPNDPVTRGQMAVFIEAALGNAPVACLGDFADVPPSHPFCGFIEALLVDGITSGCSATDFCPDNPVTRAQMAVFLVAAPPPLLP
jgi:hypothetical protein